MTQRGRPCDSRYKDLAPPQTALTDSLKPMTPKPVPGMTICKLRGRKREEGFRFSSSRTWT